MWAADNYDVLVPVAIAALVFGWVVTRYDVPSMVHDAYAYTMSALRLVRDGVYAYANGELPGVVVQPDARVTPGYISWLAVFYATLGRTGDAVQTVQSVQPVVMFAQYLMSLVAVAFTALSGRELGGRRLGLLAGVLASLFLPFAWATSVALSEAIIAPLLAAQIWMTLKVTARRDARRTAGWMVSYGALSAAVVMVRPSMAAWVLVPLVYAWVARLESWRGLAMATAMCALGFALVFGPWWIRNAQVIGTFVPLRTDVVKSADGDYVSIGTEAPPTLSAAEKRQALVSVLAAPWSAVDDVLWENNFHYDETRIDFGAFPIETHEGLAPYKQFMYFYQVAIWILAALSLLFVRRSPRVLILLSVPIYTLAVHYNTQLLPRYVYTAWPALLVLAAAGGYGSYSLVKRKLSSR